jgi:hypothetical protein
MGGGRSYSRKNQEFVADVELHLRKVCRELDNVYSEVFPHHTILGRQVLIFGQDIERVLLPGRTTLRQAQTAMARIRTEFAKRCVELQPYPLFPIRKYFEENTIINTVSSHPEVRSSFKQAFARDNAGRSHGRYGSS